MRLINQLIVICLLSTIIGVSFRFSQKYNNIDSNNGIPIKPIPTKPLDDQLSDTISTNDAQNLMKKGIVQFLDIRAKTEFEQSHILGSLNIPLENEKSLIIPTQQIDKLKHLVIYCVNGHCEESINLAARLHSMGFNSVSILEGGMKKWRSLHLPISSSSLR